MNPQRQNHLSAGAVAPSRPAGDAPPMSAAKAWSARIAIPRVAGGAAILIGGLVLVGWAFDHVALKSLLSGWVSMKPNTALGFILAGIALLRYSRSPSPWGLHPSRLARCCALAVAALAGFTLAQTILNVNFGMDQWLFQAVSPPGSREPPGRMAPITAISFLLLGLALFLSGDRARRFGFVIHSAALLGGLISLLTLIGYIYEVETLYSFSFCARMALHTAVTFLILFTGALALAPDRGLLGILTTQEVGRMVIRRLLPAAIILPIILGWLRLYGEQSGWFGPRLGVALVVATVVLLLALLIGWTAVSLNRLDAGRRRSAEVLRESEERFRATFAQAAVGIAHVAMDGRFLLVNQRYADIVGRARAELQGATFQQITHPDDLAADLDQVRRLVAGEIATYSLEKRYLRKDASSVWVNLTVSLVREDAGTPKYFIAVVEDITKRKAAEGEIRRLNAGLEQRVHERTAELEAANRELEAFSYSVSHDLRAPLRAIDGYGRILLEDHRDRLAPEGRRVLGVISSETGRMSQLIDDLLAFSQLGRRKLEFSNLNMLTLAQTAFKEQAALAPNRNLRLELQSLPPAHGDRAMLRVVLNNLIANAIKFTKSRDPAVIEIGCVESNGGRETSDEKERLPGAGHSAPVTYFVRDNGAGFDMQYASKLFGVFQRLHSAQEFEGTGVGLSLVQRVIHRHGGRVWAEGRVNAGATFYFTLPVLKETP